MVHLRSSMTTDLNSEHDTPNFNTEDEIKSLESKVKEFRFQQIEFTNETMKCIAFWKIIRELPIKPAAASFVLSEDSQDKQTAEKSFNQDSNKECDCESWCKALYELQKRNMDKVAVLLATVGKRTLVKQCKYCKNINDTTPKRETPDDLTILNKFMASNQTLATLLPKSTQTSLKADYVERHKVVGKVASFTEVYEPIVKHSSNKTITK